VLEELCSDPFDRLAGMKSPPMVDAGADRFRADLGALLPDGKRLGLAVSGGPDSMAMLLLAAQVVPEAIEVATVDHGLRAEAAEEAALVGRACAQLKVPHRTLKVAVQPGEGIQAAARGARYDALAGWCRERGLAVLATAHHADDQAETLLMRLGRGAGLSGLSAIRATRDVAGVTVIRPLLGWRRAELATVVAEHAVVTDPSNTDPRYDRTRIRALLAKATDLDPLRLAASAKWLGEADAALEWMTREALRSRVERREGRIVADIADLPRELRRRILSRLIAEYDSPADGPAVEMAMARLDQGAAASLGGLKLSPGNRITMEKAPARR